MGVRIKDENGSLKRWESELAGWEIPRMQREMFYTAAEAMLQATKAYTHVETGSLRASGSLSVKYDATRSALEAEITYGGAAPGGVHDPVRYSVYEAARGPEHNPLEPIYTMTPDIEMLLSNTTTITGRII